MQEKAWADARQQTLGILDTLKVAKEDILASLLSIGLPKAKPGISRRDLCGYLFDEAEKHGKLGGILTVLQDELSRQTEAARERQEKRLERVAEQRQQYAALFGVLCKEAGIAMPELGFDQTASDIEHGRLIRLLVEVGGLLGLISDKEFAHERFIYDVVWRKIPAAVPSHVFEVQVGGNLTEALARLKSAANLWNSKIFLVANSKDTEKARWMLGGSFPDIAQSMRFLVPAEVAEYVEMKRRLAEFERRFNRTLTANWPTTRRRESFRFVEVLPLRSKGDLRGLEKMAKTPEGSPGRLAQPFDASVGSLFTAADSACNTLPGAAPHRRRLIYAVEMQFINASRPEAAHL